MPDDAIVIVPSVLYSLAAGELQFSIIGFIYSILPPDEMKIYLRKLCKKM